MLGYENPGFAHDADETHSRYRPREKPERKTEIRLVFDEKSGLWIKRRFKIFPTRFRRIYDRESGRTELAIVRKRKEKPIPMRPAAMRAKNRKKKHVVRFSHNKRTGRVHVSFG